MRSLCSQSPAMDGTDNLTRTTKREHTNNTTIKEILINSTIDTV